MKSLFRHLLIQILILLLAFPPVVFAGVVPDASAPANKRPSVDKAANGVPLVNITAPNKKGLSHNQYNQFDVDKRGLILNNSERAVGTQLGGIVGGNPNLGGGKAPAKTILNEVTGANRSHIEGYIEVGGQKADVILANPYGVTVNGGGFINVDRAVISTGRPEMQGDKLLLRVDGGDVRIEGAGINASNITGFDVVSRAAEINATVHAKDLSITTGRNSYDPKTREATPLAPDGSQAPTVAIDSSALGGMYAGRITLTSTEKGVGVNLDGVVQSVGDLEITADGKLAVKAAQAGGNMKLTAKGAGLEVKKAVVAEGDLTAKADRIDIKKDAAMASGLDLRLEATQALSLDENAWAVGGRAVEVATTDLSLKRDAALEGGSLKVEAKRVAAEGASLAGAGKVDITADTVTLTDSSLAAGGVLWLDLTDALTVDAGSAVLGYGGLHVKADSLENNGLVYSGNAAELLLTSFLRNQGGADILTKGDLLITGAGPNDRVALVRNEHSYIESLNGSIYLDADVFENYGGLTTTHEVEDGQEYVAIGTNLGADKRMRKRSHLDKKMPNEIRAYMNEQAEKYGTPAEGYKKTEGMQEWVSYAHDEMDEEAAPAALVAGKNIVINAGEVRNTLSVISAGKDLSITADRLVNEGVDLFSHRRTDRFIVSTYWVSGSGWSGGHGELEGRMFNYHGAEIYDTVLSLITAGRNVTLNLTNPQEGALVIGDEGDFAGRSHGTPALSDYLASGVADGGSASGGLKGLNLPGLGGLFSLSNNPDHPYLIETNQALTNFGYFYGSDYFLSRMGIDLDRLQMKLLGDAFYESRLIREQITALAGVRYLVPGVDDDAETIRALMDNAVEAGLTLDLSVGVALTPEQAARLDKDIVWLEEVDYNGQKALAPRLYLSSATRENLPALRGGTISGDTVVVQGQGSVATGLIAGNTVKVLSTTDVRNRGAEIFGKDTLVVASAGSVINQSGTLSGKDVLVSAGKDIVNETLLERQTQGSSWSTESQQQGLISATNDLRLEAGQDIRFAGARAEAGNTAALVAGNDVVLESKAVEFGHKKKDDRASLTGQAGSSVSGANVGIQAGQDITLAGSRVTAQENAQITAGRDITLLAVQGESHMYSKNTSSGGMGRTHTEVLQRDETKALGSTVTAGEDINLRAGADAAQGKGNIAIIGSGVTAGTPTTAGGAASSGNVNVTATGNVLMAGALQSSVSMEGQSKSSLVASSMKMRSQGATTYVGGSISGDNVSIHAGDNVLLTGSKVEAANDLLVKADTGDVIAAAAQETVWNKEESKTSGLSFAAFSTSLFKTINMDVLKASTVPLINYNLRVDFAEYSSTKSRHEETRNAGSSLTAGHDLAVSAAGDTVLIGSSAKAGNDLFLTAGRDVNILPGAVGSLDETVKKEGSVGIGFSLTETQAKVHLGYLGTESGMEVEKSLNARSTVEAGNNVGILAGEDVNIHGSTVAAGKDLNVVGENINLLAPQDVTTVNAYTRVIEAGFVAQANQSVTTAARKLLGIDDTFKNAYANKGAAGTVSGAQQAIDSMNNAVTVARPSASAKLGVGASYMETSAKSASGTPVPTVLGSGQDMNLAANNNLTIEGATMKAGKDMVLSAGNDVVIVAAEGEASAKSSMFKAEAFGGIGAQVGFPGGAAAGWRVEASVAGNKAEEESSTNGNADISAGERLAIVSGRDALVSGANIEAKNVALDIGRNFTLASAQDEMSGHSSSYSIGGSATFGYGVAFELESVGGSLGLGWGSKSGNLVQRQTSIIGQESLVAQVGEHTHIKGAILAAGGDNLLLDTGTLSYEDIHAKQKSSEVKFGISGEWKFDGAKADNSFQGGKADSSNEQKGATAEGRPLERPESSKTDGGSSDGSLWSKVMKGLADGTESPIQPGDIDYINKTVDQKLYATIGSGTIVLRDDPGMDLGGLNRDTAHAMDVSESGTKLHIGPVLGDVKSVMSGFAIKDTLNWYMNEDVLTVKDIQLAEVNKLIADKNSALNYADRENIQTRFEKIDSNILISDKNAEKKKFLEQYQNATWMPHYFSEKKDFALQLDYTLRKSIEHVIGPKKVLIQ